MSSLQERARRVVEACSPDTTAGEFFTDIAWGELLEEASGVPRLQISALLTRNPPGSVPSDASGADLADIIRRYRDDVATVGGGSDPDAVRARLDASIAELRQLGPLAPAAPAGPAQPDAPAEAAPLTEPQPPPATPVSTVSDPQSDQATPPAPPTHPAPPTPSSAVSDTASISALPPPIPTAPTPAVATAPPGPASEPAPVSAPGQPILTSTPVVQPTPAENAARQAELTRAATAMRTVLDRTRRTVDPQQARPQAPPRPQDQVTAVPPTRRPTGTRTPTHPRQAGTAATGQRPEQPPAKHPAWIRIVRAFGGLLVALVAATRLMGDSDPEDWPMLAVFMAIVTGLLFVKRIPPYVRIPLGAMPGSLFLASAMNWGHGLNDVFTTAILVVSAALIIGYLVVAVRASWQSAKPPQRRAPTHPPR